MSLISSHRHTPADLALWHELEAADRINGRNLDRRVDEATAAILSFLARGVAYGGTSWGKDSVVLAHLLWTVARDVPLIHLRPSNHNPDCDAVRDAYFTSFPGQPYSEIAVDYADLHAACLSDHELDRETDRLWYATIKASGAAFDGRHILGIRAAESNGRDIRMRRWGLNSPCGCAPLGHWSTADVFAYLAMRSLPVHPAYAMLGGGRWPRERLRVAEIGDTHGKGSGRRSWETEYYGDLLRRLEAGRLTSPPATPAAG